MAIAVALRTDFSAANLRLLAAVSKNANQTVENVWQHVRSNWLSTRDFDTYDDIIDAACDAWRRLIAQPETIASIGMPMGSYRLRMNRLPFLWVERCP